jgi:hypothetical protein
VWMVSEDIVVCWFENVLIRNRIMASLFLNLSSSTLGELFKMSDILEMSIM